MEVSNLNNRNTYRRNFDFHKLVKGLVMQSWKFYFSTQRNCNVGKSRASLQPSTKMTPRKTEKKLIEKQKCFI